MNRLTGLLLFLPACLALAGPVQRPHIEVELLAEKTSVRAGEVTTLALRMKSQEHWHTYWRNPGDSGLPTRITWTLPRGFEAGPIQWPVPSRINIGPLTNFGFEGEIFLLSDIKVPDNLTPGTTVAIEARADWLVCEEICIPGDANFRLDLPVDFQTPANDPKWSRHFNNARKNAPVKLEGWEPQAFLQGGDLVIRLAAIGQTKELNDLTFFPDMEGWIENAAPQRLFRSPNAFELRISAATDIAQRTGPLSGLLVASSGVEQSSAASVSMPYRSSAPSTNAAWTAVATGNLSQAIRATPLASLGLLAAIGAAFLGGIILNLMPCVFPVVSIKVLGFVEQAHGNSARLRAHGLAFTAGVLVSFWVVAGVLLALRSQGEALGWGYQLQSPLVVTALALLFFVMALNLSGVFEFGAHLQSWLGHWRLRNAYADSALAGLVATVVATPCTAPFMGAALGFALVQPATQAMLVFSALALGMAAPYLVLSFSPALIARLPRPGAWMARLKQWLAFPLYLTVAWLAWVLGRQLGVDAMARLIGGLILIAAAMWVSGNTGGAPHRQSRRPLVALATGGILAALGIALAWPGTSTGTANTAKADDHWQPWTETAVTQARAAGKAVFVDFTAAWCVTCQINKRLVLESKDVERRLLRGDVALFRADWTQRDADITAALSGMGRIGVPVYAVFAARTQGAPVLLPELLTRERVLDAIEDAVTGRAR